MDTPSHHGPAMDDFLNNFEADLTISRDPINIICFHLPASSTFGYSRWLGVSAWRSWRARSLLGLQTIIKDSYPNAVFHTRGEP